MSNYIDITKFANRHRDYDFIRSELENGFKDNIRTHGRYKINGRYLELHTTRDNKGNCYVDIKENPDSGEDYLPENTSIPLGDVYEHDGDSLKRPRA
jgi:hypothetical protein